jgi:hypothetical protein
MITASMINPSLTVQAQVQSIESQLGRNLTDDEIAAVWYLQPQPLFTGVSEAEMQRALSILQDYPLAA